MGLKKRGKMYEMRDEFVACVTEINPAYPMLKVAYMVGDIFNQYSEFFRAYHTLAHIKSGLDLLKEVEELCEDYFLVQFAWWYHDYICLPNSTHNEIISADQAVFHAMHLNLNDTAIKKIRELILASKHNGCYTKAMDERIIHDIDLSILGSEPKVYNKYVKDIEDEYSVFIKNSTVFNTKRLELLNGFLSLKRIYHSEYFHERFDKIARENIKKEIAIRKGQK